MQDADESAIRREKVIENSKAIKTKRLEHQQPQPPELNRKLCLIFNLAEEMAIQTDTKTTKRAGETSEDGISFPRGVINCVVKKISGWAKTNNYSNAQQKTKSAQNALNAGIFKSMQIKKC